MKTILLLQKPIEALKVFADLKFSLIGFLFFKIKTSKKYLLQVKKSSYQSSYRTLYTELHFLNEIIFEKCVKPSKTIRRGGRVVECGSLENCCSGNATEGSNPSFSALKFPELFSFQFRQS
jgi:hypothetical protein